MKNSIISNAVEILDENRGETPILDYHNQQKENDPKYCNFLFGSEAANIGDFGIGMTKKQMEAFDKFEEGIETLNDIRENYEL